MEERIRPTKSGLFAIELLIAIGVFAFCAAICVGIFTRAEVMSRDSADLNRAVSEARNVAECFKAAGGDSLEAAALCGGQTEGGIILLRYGRDWQRVDAGGEYLLSLTPQAREGYTAAELKVERSGGAEPLLQWEIAALPLSERSAS